MNIGNRRLDWLLPKWLEDVDAYSQSTNEDVVSVAYTFLVNFAIFSICIAIFSAVRRNDENFYRPKVNVLPNKTPPSLTTKSWLGWINELAHINDQIIIDKGGYDVLFLIRFYRLSFRILLYSSIYAWVVLLPLNGTGNASVDYLSFDRWSMTNIAQKSGRCWFHLFGIYLLSGITIYFLEEELIVYAKYRHIFLRQTHTRLRTVLVEGIPHKMRSTTSLRAYFEALYPNAILSVRLGQDLKYLDKLVAERLDVVTKLERCLYEQHLHNTRPTVSVPNMTNKVDAIKYYTQRLIDLNASVTKEQEIANKLASYDDIRRPSQDAKVIQEFLKVTEIDSTKKMILEDDLRQNNVESNKYLSYQYGTSLKSNNSSEQSKYIEMNGGDNNEIEEFNGSTYSSFRLYKMSYNEWFWAMWTSSSSAECWRLFRSGRNGEDHTFSDDERLSLISPPEERKFFLSKAFVTFKTFTSATIARQVLHMQLAGHMALYEAPEPSDVTWINLYTTRKATNYRRIIIDCAVLLLIVVWVAPVTLLSFIFSKQALSNFFPWVQYACDKSIIFESLVQLAQPLAIVAIMNLLPPILGALAILEGCISFSSNQFKSFNRYFTFQIINVFLVTTIAGSVIDCLKEILDEPSSAFSLLGTSLPKMGGFFTNYILVKAFTGLGIELIRLPALTIALLKRVFTPNITPRDRRKAFFESIRNFHIPGWFPYSKIYAQDMLLFIVCATYACIAPLILVAGLFYFSVAELVYKHQMLFVYEPIFETGGKWLPRMGRCYVLALLFAQSTMVGMMLLKETFIEIYYLVFIIGLTSIYYWHIMTTYETLANQLPLDMAVSMDLDPSSINNTPSDDINDYNQPSLRAPPTIEPELEFDYDKKVFNNIATLI
eukprot:gene9590-12916_t